MMTRNVRTHSPLLWITTAALFLIVSAASCKKDENKKKPPEVNTPPVETPKTKDPAQDTPKPGTQEPAGAGEAPNLADVAGTYTVDPSHSAVVFRAKHLGVSYTYGRFNKVEGALTLDADVAKCSVSLDVTADSVFTANKDRDDHLKNTDFLNTKQFPKITFKSTAVKQAAPGKYEVTGDLTLHGVTKAVTATFEHVGAGPHPMDKEAFLTGFHGYLTVKRSDFDMKYMIGGISDEIDLMVSIEASRKK